VYVIRFGKLRVIEFADPLEFELHTQRWLAIREAENAYLYMMLADIKHAAAGGARGAGAARLFTIEDNGAIVAAGALPAADTLCMTWATEAMIDVLADHAVQKGWNLRTIYSPEPVSRLMARALAARCGLALEIGRGERVYQLAQVGYRLPEGRLEAATPADLQLLRGWTNHYAAEVAMERTAPDERAVSLAAAGSGRDGGVDSAHAAGRLRELGVRAAGAAREGVWQGGIRGVVRAHAGERTKVLFHSHGYT